ncbi:hypothetical protein BHK69_25770 [Bosea vaviloviae]|uniref:Uncharacterized protein n=1 Tax=Bosea vaviloviae TaxID=1526658 RepID=A0A1D7U7R6_9HYPH|nr:hypothetical protein BHK69_25770 [Bosea vaviloviae]
MAGQPASRPNVGSMEPPRKPTVQWQGLQEVAMRDGNGNQMSPEEQQKVKSIQGAPDERSLRKVSVEPGREGAVVSADNASVPPSLPPGLKGEE